MNDYTVRIEVLGSGCRTCKALFERTKQAAEELGLSEEVEYVTDPRRIMEMGVMESPVLAINGTPILAGALPEIEIIKETVRRHLEHHRT